MKATFTIDNPHMLAEASAGDLFVPLGPDLVECVCALRCVDSPDGVRADMPAAAHFNPDAMLSIAVIACRVGAGEPEYYPPGYCTTLPGAAPVVFVLPDAPLQLHPRVEPLAPPLIQPMQSLTQRHAHEALAAIKVALCTGDIHQLPPHLDTTREELSSRL